MKNMKKKILLAGLFSVLMLMMPINCIAQKEGVENLELQAQEEELEFIVYNNQYSIINFLETIGKYSLKLLIYEIIEDFGLESIEYGEVVINAEELNAYVESIYEDDFIFINQEIETTGIEDTGLTGDEATSNYIEDEAEIKEENIESGYLDSKLAETLYLESEEDIYSYILGDIFNIGEYRIPRLGYLCGIIEFMQLKKDLKNYIWENITPPVTYIEIIEETAAWFGFDVDVEYYIFNTLNNTLQDIAENRPWIIEGLGIRRTIYETYILPLLLSYGIPFILQAIHARLNSTVLDMKAEFGLLKGQLKKFIKSFFFDMDLSPFRYFLDVLKGAFKLGISLIVVVLYMNETQIQEWLAGIEQSFENWITGWGEFYGWISTEPWLEPILINGSVTGLESENLEGVLVYCKSDQVYTDQNGTFKDLTYTTSDVSLPFLMHECIVTAHKDNLDTSVHGKLVTGAFSDGKLSLLIDFQDDGDTKEYCINNEATTYEVETQETSYNNK